MKWLKVNLFLVALFLIPNVVFAMEEVKDFYSEITPFSDGSFSVVETIVYDFGDASKHGIFRYIPTEHPQEASVWYKTRRMDVDLQAVSMDGVAVPYEVKNRSSDLFIKIGDADKEITGIRVYKISYTVRGGLSYYEPERAEIYWNVTGHDWVVPIKSVHARVLNTDNLLLPQRFCYVGIEGTTDSCQSITATTSLTVFGSTSLDPGSGLTIAQELDSSKIDRLVIEDSPMWIFWVLGVIAWFSIVGIYVYKYKTAYNPRRTVVSQYEPFEDFKPMFTGVLFDGRLDDRDITAGLVYLAEQGFIKIEKTQAKVMLFFEVDDYDVTLLRGINDVETDFLKNVLLLLFTSSDVIGATIKLSKLKSDTSKQKENARSIKSLRDAVTNDLEVRGYVERVIKLPTVIFIIGLLVMGLAFAGAYLDVTIGVFIMPILLLVFGTVVILAFAHERRTSKGFAALNHLKGFKEFLSVTEKDRYEFHNTPTKSPEQFMQFLPYAIAFGVEKEWAKVFEDIAVPSPSWYEDRNGGAFSAVALTSDLGAFSSSFLTTTNSSPSSGSNGGGFSGGGAGGGGGGSW